MPLGYLAHDSLSVGTHLSLDATYDLMKKPDAAEDHRRGSLLIAWQKAKHFGALLARLGVGSERRSSWRIQDR